MAGSAEVISIGTELLLGDILNSNAQFLAQELASLGIPHYFQTAVGDNPQRIQQVIQTACDRSNLLIFTGGLGPTPDDLTVATIADFFGADLEERPEVIADIQQKYAQRNRSMPKGIYKQALLPKGADVLPNPTGSAPGIIWQPRSGITLMTFPGVPSELQVMWAETAASYLQEHGWSNGAIVSRMLKFWGTSESTLVKQIGPLLDQANPTVAPYANLGESRLRITARADSYAAAEQMIAPIAAEILGRTGQDCYGADADTLATVVGDLLRSRQQTLAVAESCTGGGLGQMLTEVPGSSDYFYGGVIAYANSVKQNLLRVEEASLEQEGAVSDAVAQQMALGVQQLAHTDWALSITGIAGPGGSSPNKPVGLVYVGLATPDKTASSQVYRFGSSRPRDWIRQLSACSALDQLRRALI
ncbi:competence/damage-inducible protein A [filamentous cyanobacterium CCP5]|nr:competence/damage-inducible protein A [filamentous cyanobacterium CCP5]